MIWHKKNSIWTTICDECDVSQEMWELEFKGDNIHCGTCDMKIGMRQDLPIDLLQDEEGGK